jgi:hypothetical protein
MSYLCRYYTEDNVNFCEEMNLQPTSDDFECPFADAYTFDTEVELPSGDGFNLGSGAFTFDVKELATAVVVLYFCNFCATNIQASGQTRTLHWKGSFSAVSSSGSTSTTVAILGRWSCSFGTTVRS